DLPPSGAPPPLLRPPAFPRPRAPHFAECTASAPNYPHRCSPIHPLRQRAPSSAPCTVHPAPVPAAEQQLQRPPATPPDIASLISCQKFSAGRATNRRVR